MTSNDMDKHEVEQKIKDLTDVFSKKLLSRLAEIRGLYDELFDQTTNHADNVIKIHHIAHTLAGSSGTFGLNKVSHSFKELENYISEISLSFPISSDDEHSKILTEKIDSIEIAINKLLLKS